MSCLSMDVMRGRHSSTTDCDGQEVKVQGHRRSNLDLEIWRRSPVGFQFQSRFHQLSAWFRAVD